MQYSLALADLERIHGVTWQDLAEQEPRLWRLLWRARQLGATCRSRWDTDCVFRTRRNEVADLVGFLGANRDHPMLGSVGAYEVVCRRVYDAVASLVRVPAVSGRKIAA
jgi:hypothetical protein